MKTGAAIIAGLAFGMVFASVAVIPGCSCPPGHEMISVEPGTYVAEDPSVGPDYRLEIAHAPIPAIERYTRDGKQIEVIYQGRPPADDADGGD